MLGFLIKRKKQAFLATADETEKNLGKWIVIDCRDAKTTLDQTTGEPLKGYCHGHIPKAISLGSKCTQMLRDEKSRVKKKDELEKILGNAGISNDKTVVVYSDAKRITYATVVFWIFEYLGHPDVRFLDGGIGAWEAEGRSLEFAETKLQPTTYTAHVINSRIATTDEVLKIAKGQLKGAQLIDSRTAEEYEGIDIRAKRGGHIPNCRLNVPHAETYDNATGTIKPLPELEKIYNKLDKNKRTILYCQTGTRSTLTYLELRLMGFKKPALYDDSWIIWGDDEGLPIEKE